MVQTGDHNIFAAKKKKAECLGDIFIMAKNVPKKDNKK